MYLTLVGTGQGVPVLCVSGLLQQYVGFLFVYPRAGPAFVHPLSVSYVLKHHTACEALVGLL